MNLKNSYFIILMVKYYKVDSIDIKNLVAFHAPNKKFEIIEYNSKKMNVDCIKKKYPLMSLMIPKGQCIFTEIDMEMYKYKNISGDNTFYIVNPQDNTYVLFDSSKFYVGEGTKINIWDEYIDNSYVEIENQEIIFENETMGLDLKQIIYSVININCNNNHTFIKVTNIFRKNDITRMYEKYGTMADEILPYIENKQIDENNRFSRIKLIQNVLSKDVCYWIMNEAEKQQWSDCKHKNYSSCLSIEKIPAVLNFVIYSCHYWLDNVKQLYDFYDIKLELNIKEIFIAKDDISYVKEKRNDDAHIIFNIQLNNTTEYLEYNEKRILLNQGDMIVYNNQTMRTRGNNYVLVLMIEFVL